MNLHSEYKAERINRNSYKDFVNIYNKVIKSKIKINFPENKFNTVPATGIENIGFIVYHLNGEPVAFYGVYPLFAYLRNKKILIAQSGDTMTKPEHTGLGLFICSAELTYNLCKENHIDGVFGFPSPSSYRTFSKKLNWKFNGNLKKYRFIVPAIPIAFITEKVNFLKPLYLWWVRIIISFYKKSEFFEGSIVRNGQDGILRDEAFWNYKMSSGNNFALNIGGTNLVIKTNGTLSIGDIEVNSKTEIRPILKKLKLLAFLTFNAHVVFHMSPGTVLDEKLSSVQAGTEGLPIGYINFNNEFDLSTLKFTYFDFDTF
jgi:hypothetical protein